MLVSHDSGIELSLTLRYSFFRSPKLSFVFRQPKLRELRAASDFASRQMPNLKIRGRGVLPLCTTSSSTKLRAQSAFHMDSRYSFCLVEIFLTGQWRAIASALIASALRPAGDRGVTVSGDNRIMMMDHGSLRRRLSCPRLSVGNKVSQEC